MDSRHDHHHHADAETDQSAMAELLDLDAEVLHSLLSDVTAWIGEQAPNLAPKRILDLGSGTGAGTFALLQCFDGADAIAVDVSAQMLARLSDKARIQRVGHRVRTIQADLDDALPPVGVVDLVLASLSLHHVADPGRVLTEVVAAMGPGGMLVVLELESFPRFLPDDIGLGRPGLEARCHAALAERQAHEMPLLGADWAVHLSRAGLTVAAVRRFDVALAPPLPAATGRYAQASLRRMRSGLDGQLGADDLAALDTILDSEGPEGILHRDDLTVRAARTAWVAIRP